MKINLAKTAGFCFGVKRALKIALKTLCSGNKVYILGDIVHNEDVVKQIKKSGIKKIETLNHAKNGILLIPAHGAGLNISQQAEHLGYKIIDATCPMVKKIHKIAKGREEKGYRIIVIGDKKHAEVEGIVGQLKGKAIIIDGIKRLPLKTIKKIKKACIVVQSTQNLENVSKIVGILKLYIKEIEFFNTVCKPTQAKQREIKTMPLENDVMIILGSKSSANTKRLYEIAKSLNKRSYWINSEREINPGWLKAAASLGITAGASTPESTIQNVINYISSAIPRHINL